MKSNKILNTFSKEELTELIKIYSKNWLAMDGLWFQSVEKELGMDKAIYHDKEVWKSFTVIEAKRIKRYLDLPEHPGLEGLKNALSLRLYANINSDEIIENDDSLTYRVLECRVQSARKQKNLGFHPCKSVGIIEYSGFAKTIDSRIDCKCLSCYPDITDNTCSCSWQFTLNDDTR